MRGFFLPALFFWLRLFCAHVWVCACVCVCVSVCMWCVFYWPFISFFQKQRAPQRRYVCDVFRGGFASDSTPPRALGSNKPKAPTKQNKTKKHLARTGCYTGKCKLPAPAAAAATGAPRQRPPPATPPPSPPPPPTIHRRPCLVPRPHAESGCPSVTLLISISVVSMRERAGKRDG